MKGVCAREGCTVEFEQPGASGRRRTWCSDRCRKRQYDLVCVDCGGRVDGSTPGRMREPVCVACAPLHYAVWPPEAIIAAIQEWANEAGGIPPSATDIQRARAANPEIAFPCVNEVQWRFGSWNAGIIAAGFEPHASGPVGGFRALTDPERRECARRYAAGEPSTRIAADLGCSPQIVLKWARRAGVDIREAPIGRRAAA